ncbi:hypothetical protein ASD84_13320 [Nocardioides sp. Root682]|nr:hypothetical protein ASD84_13320 [Nocardioides sp. Root682]
MTGEFRTRQERTDALVFIERVELLSQVGTGYAEVSLAGRVFPMLALSFSGDNGVVHQFASAERTLLLRGGGSVNGDVAVEVPILEGSHPFTGDFVSTARRARKIVEDFVAGVEPASLGQWDEL